MLHLQQLFTKMGSSSNATAAGTIGVANNSTAVLLGSLNGVFYTDASSTQKPTWANHLAASNMLLLILSVLFLTTLMKGSRYNQITYKCYYCTASVFFNYNADSYLLQEVHLQTTNSKVELDDASTGVSSTAQLKIIRCVSKDPDNSDLH